MGISKYANICNSFPENMQEMTEESWQDFFTYCIEGIESRQAFRNSIYEIYTDLRIFWIRESLGLGVCISRRYESGKPKIEFYRIGTQENWDKLKGEFAAANARDNS